MEYSALDELGDFCFQKFVPRTGSRPSAEDAAMKNIVSVDADEDIASNPKCPEWMKSDFVPNHQSSGLGL
jgi:hypothetical protein